MRLQLMDVCGEGIGRTEEMHDLLPSASAIVGKECPVHAVILMLAPPEYQQWILRQILGQIRS